MRLLPQNPRAATGESDGLEVQGSFSASTATAREIAISAMAQGIMDAGRASTATVRGVVISAAEAGGINTLLNR